MSRTLKPLSVKAPRFMLTTKPIVNFEELSITDKARKVLTTQKYDLNTETDSDDDYRLHLLVLNKTGDEARLHHYDSSYLNKEKYNVDCIKEHFTINGRTRLFSFMNGNFKQYIRIIINDYEECWELLDNLVISLDMKEEA